MGIKLLKHIEDCVMKYDTFLEQTWELGHSTAQKVTAALHMLAYGIPADLVDDHLAMGESQAIRCASTLQLQRFECLVKCTWQPPMLKTQLGFWSTTKIMAF
jgi:hypothetical protein